MLSPLMSIVGVIFSFSVSVLLYIFTPLDPLAYFFTPILVLIFYHTVAMQFVKGAKYQKQALVPVLKKSIGKYVFWLAIMAALYGIYTVHPFYIRFASHTTLLIAFFIKVYIVAGLPYFIYVERHCTGFFERQNDPYLKMLSLCKSIYKRRWAHIRFRLFNKGYKSLFLSWLIRLHFLPIMVEQVYWGSKKVIHFFENPDAAFASAFFLIGVLFLIDSTNASIGYFWESNVTKTRFRAIDPNPFHWIVVLMCYVPFIRYASDFVPFPQGDTHSALLFAHPYFDLGVNALTVLVLLGIVLTTTCLGFSYSNLSYKKIQTRGPYAIVRHPGSVFKIFFFFLTIFRYKSSYSFPIIAAYLFWISVYITRAICEERFLRQFKEYRDYMEKTRYRFIPGVF